MSLPRTDLFNSASARSQEANREPEGLQQSQPYIQMSPGKEGELGANVLTRNRTGFFPGFAVSDAQPINYTFHPHLQARTVQIGQPFVLQKTHNGQTGVVNNIHQVPVQVFQGVQHIPNYGMIQRLQQPEQRIVISAPQPIIKPLVIERKSNGNEEEIDRLNKQIDTIMGEYKYIYDLYQGELNKREVKAPTPAPVPTDNKRDQLLRVKKTTQIITQTFSQCENSGMSAIDAIFAERTKRGLEENSKIDKMVAQQIKSIVQVRYV